jgi:sugar O-acyltransferase (sialic acid O-acetyltransferase NeuD family)
MKLVLVGGGGHCKSCIDVIKSTGQYAILGVLDTADKVGTSVLDYTIIGTDDTITQWAEQDVYFLITLGQIKNSRLRVVLFNKLQKHQAKIPTIKSPFALVSKYADLGKGTIVMHQACVNANAQVGQNTIINTKSLIEHDCQIGNHTHISTGAIVNGNCFIGDHVFVGSQSVIVQGVSICDNVVIGAGSTVLKSIDTEGVYVGNPARKIK